MPDDMLLLQLLSKRQASNLQFNNKKEVDFSTSFLFVGATIGRPWAFVPLGNAEGHRPYKITNKKLDTSF